MGLPWRFISANAGIVTFVMEESSGEEFALPGKLVRLMLSPVPLRSTQDATRTDSVYARPSQIACRPHGPRRTLGAAMLSPLAASVYGALGLAGATGLGIGGFAYA